MCTLGNSFYWPLWTLSVWYVGFGADLVCCLSMLEFGYVCILGDIK